MTGPQIVTGDVAQLAHVRASATRRLASKLRPARPAGLLRQGVVQSIQMTAQAPTYTVLVNGTSIPGVRAITPMGLLTGDTVYVLPDAGDWSIVGGVWGDVRAWVPVLAAASGTAPALGTAASGAIQVGAYRMTGPTTMWLTFALRFGSTSANVGTGIYSVTGLPLNIAAYEQVVPVFGLFGTSGTIRYAMTGVIGAGTNQISRLAATGQTQGASSTTPGMMMAGGGFSGTALLEVVPA